MTGMRVLPTGQVMAGRDCAGTLEGMGPMGVDAREIGGAGGEVAANPGRPGPIPARVAANRRNAARSTGPRTAAGKARSRANAIKHGLTGAGVALPGEDAARIEAEFLQFQEDLQPTSLPAMKLARRLALLSVRLDRSERHTQACAERHARHAVANFDHARAEHADRLIDAIEAQPRAYRRALMATPEGVDRLIDGLAMLLGDMHAPMPAWSDDHHKRLDALFGYRVVDLPWSRPTRFSRAVLGNFAAIGDAETAEVSPEERGGWAFLRLIEAIEAEINHLIEHRGTLDHAAIAADRAAASDLTLFDADRPAELARRYETTTARQASQTLRDFHRLQAMAADPIEDESIDQPEPDSTQSNPEPASPIGNDADHLDRKPFSSNEIWPMASFGQMIAAEVTQPFGGLGCVPMGREPDTSAASETSLPQAESAFSVASDFPAPGIGGAG